MDFKVSNVKIDSLPTVDQKTEVEVTDNFRFTLDKVSSDNFMEKMNGLMQEINVQGEKITEHMDIKDMRKYKNLITEFMNEVVTNSHEFSRENFLDKRGRHRVYGIVRSVNKELDELAQELLKSEKNPLSILDKTGQIRGLLLDLMV